MSHIPLFNKQNHLKMLRLQGLVCLLLMRPKAQQYIAPTTLAGINTGFVIKTSPSFLFSKYFNETATAIRFPVEVDKGISISRPHMISLLLGNEKVLMKLPLPVSPASLQEQAATTHSILVV